MALTAKDKPDQAAGDQNSVNAGEPAGGEPDSGSEANTKRRVNRMVLAIVGAMVVVIALAVTGTFYFVESERTRDIQAWQIRLGIVADSRAAAVNGWVEQNFRHMRELSENASLQVYMSELAFAGEEEPQGVEAPEDGEPGDELVEDDEAASASYLRNLLIATAERSGFKAPPPIGEVAANVERVGVAGIGLVDAEGQAIVSTPDMPPLSGKVRNAVAKALDGEQAVIDMFVGASGEPTMGFVLPVFGIQDDAEGAKGIGAVIGLRTVGKDLYDRLRQPGETETTSETYIVRSADATITFLTPLSDGTPAMKRSLSSDTPNLAAAMALARPGGFGIMTDYAGIEVLSLSRQIANLPWVLIRKISRDEALAATDSRLKTILIVSILMIVGITVAVIAVWRHGSSLRATQAAANMKVALERFENMTKFMTVVSNSQPNPVVAVDGETQYTFANQPAADEAGIPAADMMGKTMAGVMGPQKAQAFAEINKSVLKTFERETHIVTFGDEDDDGEHAEEFQVIRSYHVPLRGDRDYPPAVLMILSDVTELSTEKRRGEKMTRQLIDTLVSVVDRRDPFSANHSSRVAEVARCIAMDMGLDPVEVQAVDIAGNLMNLGKIFIPPETLTKTTGLTPEEISQVSNAYLTTVELIQDVEFEGPVVETIRQLGETWGGTGPLGLKEGEILLGARILAVANVFVGMVSPRAYRGAMPFQQAADILMEQTGTKYDRKPVTALINFLENRGGMRRWAHFRESPSEP